MGIVEGQEWKLDLTRVTYQNNLSLPDLQSNDPCNKTGNSDSSDNVDVEPDNNGDNVDLFEWNDTPRPLRQYGFIPFPGVKMHCQNWRKV